MADGTQREFNIPRHLPQTRLRQGEIVVDLFAGGGGASVALEQALQRAVDIAINHDEFAVGMHAANHPLTRHMREDVWVADPREIAAGRVVGWLHASPDCFPAGTMVLTAQGYRPIEEIGIGDLVLTHKGRWRAVTDTMSTERELLTLTGHGHPGLMVSAEHPFLARHRRDVWCTSPRGYRKELDPADWVKAGELDRGWYWATPHAFPEASVPAVGGRGMEITPDLLWLAGRYIGDGWTRLNDSHAELVITCGKHEADVLRYLLAKWPPLSGRSGFNELAWQERHTGTAYQFTTAHQGLVEWLREHFGQGAAEKRIPGWALGMPREFRQALLDGYCSADGHITEAFIETQSVSKALAFGIKALAESMGHTVAVYTGPNRSVIEGRTVNARPVWRCRWRHAVDAAHLQTIRDELHEWAPIRKTEHGTGHGRVYNLSVDEDESYVAEGIVVHNCTHFSQARGGQPRSRKTRSLSWVVVKWAGRLHKAGLGPRYISLENVEQILSWGPLVAKRCKKTGRVLKMDGTVAEPGERVPVNNQQLVPDKKRAGQTWARFVEILRGFGYDVEWKKVVAADHGAGTSRKRLFLVARCDGLPIVWPEPTHGPGRESPYVTAADCIDWTIKGRSIFGRKKDLADATLRRIARGIKRYVLDAEEPFIVPAAIIEHANASREAAWTTQEPLRTQCANVKGGHFALAGATLVQTSHGDGKPGGVQRWGSGAKPVDGPVGAVTASGSGGHGLASATLIQTGYGEREGQEPRVPGLGKPVGTLVDGQKHGLVGAHLVKFRGQSDGAAASDPMPTITSGAGAARPAGAAHAMGVISAVIEQAYGGPNGNPAPARAATDPLGVVTASGAQQRLVTAHMATLRGDNVGAAADAPVRTLSAGGEHHAVVQCTLSPEQEEGALRVAAFLIRYYGMGGQWGELDQPLDTITTRDRLALVTVHVRGVPYVIVDITLRMLTPPELYRAQGFPRSYIIDRAADGRKLTVSQQVRMVGNSVSPPPLFAIIDANLEPVEEPMRLAA